MTPILLIDDNSKNQRQSYGAAFVDDEVFESILHHIERVNKDFDLSILDKYGCIMIHDSLEDFINDSFDENSHVAKDLILEYLDNHHIPYVLFSDGHESTGVYDLSHNLVNLKKSSFYSRLEAFVKEYSKNNKILLHILAYGENYIKEIMIRNVRYLLQKYGSKCPNEIISLGDVMPSSDKEPHYLEEIINMAQPKIGIDYEGVLDYIEDNEITINDFTARIKQILNSISRYGKNNYTWE